MEGVLFVVVYYKLYLQHEHRGSDVSQTFLAFVYEHHTTQDEILPILALIQRLAHDNKAG